MSTTRNHSTAARQPAQTPRKASAEGEDSGVTTSGRKSQGIERDRRRHRALIRECYPQPTAHRSLLENMVRAVAASTDEKSKRRVILMAADYIHHTARSTPCISTP